MKEQLTQLLSAAFNTLQARHNWPADLRPNIRLEPSKDKNHGDFASNLALSLAKPTANKPRDIAQLFSDEMMQAGHDWLAKIEVAGPGFINFYIRKGLIEQQVLAAVIEQGEQFGRTQQQTALKIQVEFVSANPTGPLHVGHGRGAAYGSSLANILEAVGHQVSREYYINDGGRQMHILAVSTWLRYLQLNGHDLHFPDNGYQGEYIKQFAQQLKDKYSDRFVHSMDSISSNLPQDASSGGDKERYIDAVIERAKTLLGSTDYMLIHNYSLEKILQDIRQDLSEFSIDYQSWFSERSLMDDNAITTAIDKIKDSNPQDLYEKDGALWFKTTHYNDDKDRVVIRENGESTYFASDIAYHHNKFQRGFDRIINILGADHHGYIARLKAALSALDIDPDRLQVRLVQFANLYRGEERLAMSTRSGSFVTLRELREEVGNDAARFIYVTRKAEQHMDFDLELAKSQSKDNPVYYVQYAHARLASIWRKLKEANLSYDSNTGLAALAALELDAERNLIKQLSQYPNCLQKAAEDYAPHQVATYLRELASEFHTYYNAHKLIIDDDNQRNARLTLALAIQQVLKNGLNLLGVSAPNTM